MTDKEAVDFLKKARIYLNTPRGSSKQITQELYIEAMMKAINALEEKTNALPLPNQPHGEWINKRLLMEKLQEATAKSTGTEVVIGLLVAQRIVTNMRGDDEK